MHTESDHTLEKVEGEELQRIEKDLKPNVDGLVRVTPGRWLYPGAFMYTADKIYNFQWRSSDVVLIGFPKTGTTWMQEILWTMRNSPDLDHPDANLPILTRVPIIDTDMFINPKAFKMNLRPGNPLLEYAKEFKKVCPEGDPAEGIYIQMAQVMEDPRTLKTHYPLTLLHPTFLDTVKCVYIARNPRDSLVSFYHMMRLLKHFSYKGSVEDFAENIINGEMIYTPFDKHVKEAWERRNHPNLHFVFYEDLKANTAEEIAKLNKFLGTNLTQEQISKVEHYTSFAEMKARNNFTNTQRVDNPKLNEDVEKECGGFFRKGVTGTWKNQLTPDTMAKIDEWVQTTMSEIPFKYST